LLWKIEEPPFNATDWTSYLRYRMGLALDGNGRVYTGLGKDLVCLDEGTGAVLEKMAENGRPTGSIHIHKDKILVAGGDFIDIQSGKKLGSYAPGRTVIVNDRLYSISNRTVAAYRIPDGNLRWQEDVREGQPRGRSYARRSTRRERNGPAAAGRPDGSATTSSIITTSGSI
jgi:hypothetical protein